VSQWHADLDGATLARGARLTVLSDHRVVRVLTADTLSIETPDGQRFAALVVDRTAGDIRLVADDGPQVSLELLLDESLPSPEPTPGVFSRQVWSAR
jgi:hypothetical protein